MRRHNNDEGVRIGEILMPQGALIVAVAYDDDAEVASPDIVLYPGDQVIVVSNKDTLDEVRAAFRAL
jgi:Trk K+ transport system NAD-binding subunit